MVGDNEAALRYAATRMIDMDKEIEALEKRCRELEALYNKAVQDVVTKARRCMELEAENERMKKKEKL